MKTIYFLLMSVLLWACTSDRIGKYKKESLPNNFKYEIIEDQSNDFLEKNQLYIRINQKINEGQIATLAEDIYESKPKQRRFYIFYLLNSDIVGTSVYATSHFNPELDIVIIENL